jgi:hypothetical protein
MKALSETIKLLAFMTIFIMGFVGVIALTAPVNNQNSSGADW